MTRKNTKSKLVLLPVIGGPAVGGLAELWVGVIRHAALMKTVHTASGEALALVMGFLMFTILGAVVLGAIARAIYVIRRRRAHAVPAATSAAAPRDRHRAGLVLTELEQLTGGQDRPRIADAQDGTPW